MMTRDDWGRIVRDAWISWAKEQEDPKSSWLVPYEDLSEADKEADRVIAEAVLREAETEGAKLIKERARAVSFIRSDDWGVMNERRAKLIDRDLQDGGSLLTGVEKAELATLQMVVGELIDIAHPLPFERINKDWEAMFRVADRDNERLRAALELAQKGVPECSPLSNR